MSFVSQVLYYTRNSESPRRYFYWSSLAAVAAVVKDHVWVDRNDAGLIYPNIYVLLLGRSGLRKGPPVNLAKHLVKSVNNTKTYAGRVSIQGVISDLSKAKTHKNGGPPNTESAGVLFASEFSSFIINDPDALKILTDIYDRHYYETGWSYLLRNSPEEVLQKPTVTMLAASNEIYLKDALPKNAIGGGFIARTFIVYADKKARSNSGMYKTADNIPLSSLITELADISKVKGELILTDESKEYYDKWYLKLQESDELATDDTGTLERIHDHVIKTSMLISLSARRDKTIILDDVKEAIQACQSFVPSSRRVNLMGTGQAKSAPGTAILINALITSEDNSITRTLALQRYWSHFSAPELDAIVEDLVAQRAIRVAASRDETGRPEIRYTLNPEVVKRYHERQEKKGK